MIFLSESNKQKVKQNQIKISKCVRPSKMNADTMEEKIYT